MTYSTQGAFYLIWVSENNFVDSLNDTWSLNGLNEIEKLGYYTWSLNQIEKLGYEYGIQSPLCGINHIPNTSVI